MNETLKARHYERIIDPAARNCYDQLCAACEIREGGMTEPDQMLIADAAMLEQIKQQLLDDIAARGPGQERYNGRQKYYAENKSVAQLRAYMDQQRKILAELKLTPTSRKAAPVNLDDDFADD